MVILPCILEVEFLFGLAVFLRGSHFAGIFVDGVVLVELFIIDNANGLHYYLLLRFYLIM